jgi:hypothetical protein
MRRFLLLIFAGVSAALFLLVLVLWGRSYFVYEHLSFSPYYFIQDPALHGGCLIRSHHGRLFFERRREWQNVPGPYWHRDWKNHDVVFSCTAAVAPERSVQFLGFAYYSGTDFIAPSYWPPTYTPRNVDLKDYCQVIALPHWFVLMLCALPVIWWRRSNHRWRREWRRRKGLCTECGYDVRATPGRCPECGAVLTDAHAAG